ncbi:bile acid:sodium symporter family protein [Lysobacter silvisoli]|uniref:Bile acid:sodium symporter family protein n=1 Tax=Lysobacter silvisoli TaxID=2293254 RepID=A0A371JYG9_9GAMM|nr:bile acid:sodium symporter family protein [Lysobacter silvisoli]RDZ26705.1 bile acid:sodium symporter family protein [Lysobacter silvisoli]
MQDSQLLQVLLPIAIALIMTGIGMSLTPADFLRIGERPKPVLVGVLGHYLWLPALGFFVAWAFSLPAEYAVGLVLVAACPSGSSSNALTYLSRGNVALAVSLTVISGLITFISVPLLVNLALHVFAGERADLSVPFRSTALHLAVLVLIPILVGMAVRRLAPRAALKIEKWTGVFAVLVLLAIIIALVVQQWAQLPALLRGVGLPAFVLACGATAGGVLLGRWLRLDLPDALTVGIEVGVQNATLAALIALTLMKSEQIAVPALMYGMLMYIPAAMVVLYGRRAARRRAQAAA